jgi:C4-dicarboxylate-binding protein DctP
MLAAAAAAMAPFAAGAETFTLRIATENGPSHFQTDIVAGFAEALSARAQGRIDVRHTPGGQLMADRDVVRALELGQLEMAVPGIWQIDRAVPDAGLFLLPMFYGRTEADLHAAADGAPGRAVAAAIERELEVVVPGRWIDLGFTHIFGTGKPVAAYADLAGRRIRVAGGGANIGRLEALGAAAAVIPWADLPEALKLGTVDGTLTSFETVASAKLWELGLTSAFADRQYFAQYVPLVSRLFWERLPEDLQAIVAAVWEERVDAGRAMAAAAQGQARDAFIAAGGVVAEPTAEARAQARAILLSRQDALVAALGIDAGLVARTRQLLDAPP